LFTVVQPVGPQLSSVHTLLSLQTNLNLPTHFLSTHESCSVHGSPSLQGAVFAAFTQPPLDPPPGPPLGLQLSLVHALPSSQLTFCPAQTPLVQRSLVVQTFLSSHPVPAAQHSGFFGPALHTPPLHVSPVVHTSPSLQGAEFGFVTHPFFASHASVVQALPSLHLPLSGTDTHPAFGSHTSFVHAILSSQPKGIPTHCPNVHTSPAVQALLSLQLVPGGFGIFVHLPVAGTHCEAAQALSPLVSHVTALPGLVLQLPP